MSYRSASTGQWSRCRAINSMLNATATDHTAGPNTVSRLDHEGRGELSARPVG
ncbi:hypothetical protein [Stackebrandtia soli]|uniref:hypothetical protein n=1 Tax=Stackebrandtia soli TaxID=1892856 RepID=UPI0039E93D1C